MSFDENSFVCKHGLFMLDCRSCRLETKDILLIEAVAFLNDLCHPEQYGHAVTKEVRQRARLLANKIEAAAQ